MNDHAEQPAEGHRPSGPIRRLVRAALRVPLLAKVLVANAAVIAGAVALALVLVRGDPQAQTTSAASLVGLSALLALLVGGALNAAIVLLAFRPLRELGTAAERVASGELETRVSLNAAADGRLRQLADVFNGMLARLAEERERRRQLTVGALHAEDRARWQVATALYEETAQRLAGHVLRLKRIENRMEAGKTRRLVEQTRAEATETLESVRRIARDLYPPEVEELGIGPALRAYARRETPDDGPEVVVRTGGLPEDLPGDLRVAVYRIFREALSNALSHAGADRVRVRIRRQGSRIEGEVVDDGRGFEIDAVETERTRSGLGLSVMGVLAADLGGEVDVQSTRAGGTHVRVSIPLPASSDPEAEADPAPTAGWARVAPPVP